MLKLVQRLDIGLSKLLETGKKNIQKQTYNGHCMQKSFNSNMQYVFLMHVQKSCAKLIFQMRADRFNRHMKNESIAAELPCYCSVSFSAIVSIMHVFL